MSSIPRFFVPASPTIDTTFLLPPEAGRHARTVLRMRVGEAITLHDGKNRAYDTVIQEITRDTVSVVIRNVRELQVEPKIAITVGQSLPKSVDKAEQVLQHGTEIGAEGFVLFQTDRSVARMEGKDKIEKRVLRWQGIVQGAAEQSGRGVLPSVTWLAGAREVAQTFPRYDGVLILHESATIPLQETMNALAGTPGAPAKLLALVGPEGGFTDVEVELFTRQGAKPISLGPLILRTETAALVALSQILFWSER